MATARCFFSKTLDALGATADDKYLALDEKLQQALIVRRLITPAQIRQKANGRSPQNSSENDRI